MSKVTLSLRDVTGLSKTERGNIKYYTKFIQCKFADLVHMLTKDYMFNPFNYVGYTQGTQNICSDANFVVIDVDYTAISVHQRLTNLASEGLQCIVGTTSNTDDMYKYRVLIPIDRPVTALEYRYLVQGIQSNQLIADLAAESTRPAQKWYSYAGSTVLFNFDGKPLCVDDYIITPEQIEHVALDPGVDITDLLPEFNSYRHATKGSRTRSLISAGYKCLEYGMNDKQVEQVIMYVNNLFLFPKPYNDIQRRVLAFIKTQRRVNEIKFTDDK